MGHYDCSICGANPAEKCDDRAHDAHSRNEERRAQESEAKRTTYREIVKKNIQASKRCAVSRVFEVSDEITRAGYVRNPVAILTKSFEEMGELATEIGIRYMGFYKEPGDDGITGEAVDVINCMLDIIHVSNPDLTVDEFYDIINKKVGKWKSKTIGG